MPTPINTNVTPALHPDNVLAVIDTDDAELVADTAPAVEAFTTAYTALASLHDAAATLKFDSSYTDDGRTLAIAALADRKTLDMAKAFDKAAFAVSSKVKLLESQLNAPLSQSAERTHIAAEIRVHVKNMKTEERMTFVREAIERKDAETVGAILGAPPYLSGMSPLEREHQTRQWHRTTQPEKQKRLESLLKVKDMLDNHAGKVHTEPLKTVGATRAQLDKLRARQSASPVRRRPSVGASVRGLFDKSVRPLLAGAREPERWRPNSPTARIHWHVRR